MCRNIIRKGTIKIYPAEKYKLKKATPEQIKLVVDFIKLLYDNDTEKYWDLIADIDRARLYGIYLETNSDFIEIVKQAREKQRNIYERVGGNYGISDSARYLESGEVIMYMLENILVPINIIADTSAQVWPIRIRLELEKEKNFNYKGVWKIRLFDENNHQKLTLVE